MPELMQAERGLWVNRLTDEMLTIDDLFEYYERFFGPDRSGSRHSTPAWLEEIQEQLNIQFIQTNRLSINTPAKPGRASGSPRRNHPGDSVDEYSQDLASKIRDALTKSAEISSSLDSTFPGRLMQSISQEAEPPFSEEELREELRKLQIKRADLTDAGLLDRDMADVQIPDQRVEGFTLNALSIYISDAKKKLQVFDDLLHRVDLFRDIIKRRFLYKTLSVSKQEGFVFKSGDSKIPLGSLSSGEQHEIVLLYELLFRVQPNSLILIDEPEISLHIAWQQEFLKDLLQITKISEFDALIATHSPDIIHDRWDLTVNLQGPVDEAEEVAQMQVND
jgi:predicted ATP-binding protein involved in virulence